MQNLLAGQLRQKARIASEAELAQVLAELRSSTGMSGLSSGAKRLLQALPEVVTDFESVRGQFDDAVDSQQRKLDSPRVASNQVLKRAGLSTLDEDQADLDTLSRQRAEHAGQQESAQLNFSESEQRLGRTLNATESVAWDWNLTDDKLIVISSREDVLGIPRDQIEKNAPRIADFMPPGEVEHFHHKLIEHLRGNSPEFKFGVWMTDRKFKNSYMYFHGKVVERNDQGRALRMAGIMHDLTANKQVEETVGISEARRRSLTEFSSDWYWEQDDQYRYADTHGESDARGGITANDHIRRTLWELPHTYPMGFTWEAHRKTLERREPFRDLMLKRDVPGISPRYISVSGAPIFNVSGMFTGYRGIARDVTGRMRAEEALRQARHAADEASRTKAQFLARMSHEIRTSMNGVMGMTELLLSTGLDSKQRHFVETARRSGEVLLRLLNDILDYSNIEAGKLEFDCVDFDLQSIVDDVLALFANSAASKGLKLKRNVLPGVPQWVTGDPNRLRQVLSNLIDNGIKFTERGEVFVEVAVVASPAGASLLQIEVRDTGIGIAQASQARLFNAFSQADSSIIQRYGGEGLGLSISRELVTLMGGDMTLQSELGKGSVFRFTLPWGEAAPDGVPDLNIISVPMMAVSLTDKPSPPRFSGHILVAEDNPVNQEIIRAVLQANGCTVHVSKNGREALEAMQSMTFDLIFMDCQMPEMDGYTATRAIRALEQTGLANARRVPILALTAHVTQADRERCFAAGMDGFLSKPFTQAELRQELQRWLRPDEVQAEGDAVVALFPEAGCLDNQTLNELRLMDPTGELGVMQELVATYLEHTTPLIAALRSAIDKGDSAEIESCAHKTRSGSLTMGAIGVARIGLEIENLSRANAIVACRPLMTALEAEYAKAEKCLQAEIDSAP